MKWRALWHGVKVALGIASRLQAEKVIRVKELPTVEKVIEIIEQEVVRPSRGSATDRED